MKWRGHSHLVQIALAAALALTPSVSRACSVCMGDSNSNIAGASNGAIFLMLGAIGSMLLSLAAFGFYLYKRANAPIPLLEEMGREGAAQSHA